MLSPAHDVAKYLAFLGAGEFPLRSGSIAWAISVAVEEVGPSRSITIYDTGGLPPDTDQLDPTRPAFQVRVRDKDYAEAYAKQVSIRDLLTNVDGIETEDSTFTTIAADSEIISLGRDDGNHHILTANYRAIRERN